MFNKLNSINNNRMNVVFVVRFIKACLHRTQSILNVQNNEWKGRGKTNR